MPEIPEASKDRGFLAEMMFALDAKKNGHSVCTPVGDNDPFDVVLYNPAGRFIRVQIKSCLKKEPGRTRHIWTVKKGGPKTARPYSKQDIDVLALYAYDENAWWFIPIETIGLDVSVKIDDNSALNQFKDNWDIFK